MLETETGEKASKGKKKVSAKKSAKKKNAAKRSPPPPVDTNVFNVNDIPSMPALRHALVSWGTGQGHQADQDTALIAREMSEKTCHFCGAPSSPTMLLGKPWAEVELCTCLERVSPGIGSYADTMKGLGHMFKTGKPLTVSAATGDGLSDFKKKYGSVRLKTDHYQEFFPDWKNRIPEIMELARKRMLSHAEFIYANQCSCGTDFSVTAGMIVRSMTKYGSHIEMKKCKSCRDNTLAATGKNVTSDEAADTHMAKPSNKRKRRNGLVELPSSKIENAVVASTGDGDASLGDVMREKLAELQQGGGQQETA
jgi:hypothetical protein